MSTLSLKSRNTLVHRSQSLAGTPIMGAEYKTDYYAHWIDLYRTQSGKFFLDFWEGPGSRFPSPKYIDRASAIQFVAECCAHHGTGFNWSPSQAALIVDGQDPGKAAGMLDDGEIIANARKWRE